MSLNEYFLVFKGRRLTITFTSPDSKQFWSSGTSIERPNSFSISLHVRAKTSCIPYSGKVSPLPITWPRFTIYVSNVPYPGSNTMTFPLQYWIAVFNCLPLAFVDAETKEPNGCGITWISFSFNSIEYFIQFPAPTFTSKSCLPQSASLKSTASLIYFGGSPASIIMCLSSQEPYLFSMSPKAIPVRVVTRKMSVKKRCLPVNSCSLSTISFALTSS